MKPTPCRAAGLRSSYLPIRLKWIGEGEQAGQFSTIIETVADFAVRLLRSDKR